MAHEIKRTRETWVDAAKVLACVLVVLGHFYQALVGGKILESTTTYIWFNRTIYYFHVPLFFLCSGYLYQQDSWNKAVSNWKTNVLNKLFGLGIPFAVFACGSWAVNTYVYGGNGDLAQLLFVKPAAPYWYLYTLFFVFLVTPTMKNTTNALVIGGSALCAKALSMFMGDMNIFALDSLLEYWLWFVIGMLLSYYKVPKTLRRQKVANLFGVALALLFVVGSVALVMRGVSMSLINLIFGILGCSAVVILFVTAKFSESTKKVIQWLSDNTLPVYLMHMIFNVVIRNELLRLGVTNAAVHVAAGLVAIFGGPLLVGVILKKLKWTEFILYPEKFLKIGTEEKTDNRKKVREHAK